MGKERKKTNIEKIIDNSRDSPWDNLDADEKEDVHISLARKDLNFLQTLKEHTGVSMSEFVHMLISTVKPDNSEKMFEGIPEHIQERMEKRRRLVARKYFRFSMEEIDRLNDESRNEIRIVLTRLKSLINSGEDKKVERIASSTHDFELEEFPDLKEEWYSLLEENGYEIPEKKSGLFDN